MIRYEIIANHSVRHDLLELIEQADPGIHYSIFPQVFGKGRQGHRKGDSIWPESNLALICYIRSEEESKAILRAVCALKKQFPSEGIKIFAVPTVEVEL